MPPARHAQPVAMMILVAALLATGTGSFAQSGLPNPYRPVKGLADGGGPSIPGGDWARLPGGREMGPPASVYVDVVNRENSTGTPRNKQVSCENGIFVLKGISPGTNRVRFNASQHQAGFRDTGWALMEEIDFSEGEAKRIQKSIPTGNATLSGKILVHGIPMEEEYGVSINLTREEQDPKRSLQVSSCPNEDGNYVFGSLPSGSWQMSVHSWDNKKQEAFDYRKQIPLADGETLRLDINCPEAASQ